MIKVDAFEIFERFNEMPKEQLELAQLIFRCGMRGDEIKSDNIAVEIAARAILNDSFKSRENYYARQKKNAEYGVQGKEYGIQGKEYGVQGKEYGVLGKEYGKLGGRPTNEFKKVLNEIISDKDLVVSIQNDTITKEEIDIMMERYDRKTLTNVLQWIKEKYNFKR